MKIQAYYVRSRKLYFPCKFPQEVFGINDTLRYFIYGEGYKKTRAYDIVEIEIPTTKDNIQDIRETYNKYGKQICMEYLITNNSIYWKRDMLSTAINTTMTSKDANYLVETFKLFSWSALFTCFGLVLPNVVGLDNHMIKNFGYDIKASGMSLREFIIDKFGQEAHDKLVEVWGLEK